MIFKVTYKEFKKVQNDLFMVEQDWFKKTGKDVVWQDDSLIEIEGEPLVP